MKQPLLQNEELYLLGKTARKKGVPWQCALQSMALCTEARNIYQEIRSLLTLRAAAGHTAAVYELFTLARRLRWAYKLAA